MAYSKPTLVEMYAELYLSNGTLSEGRFFDIVPELKRLGFSEVELASAGFSLDITQGRPFPREKQRVLCWKPGRTELVQVGEDVLTANLTGNYTGWGAFTRLFTDARQALTAGLGTIQITSLNLATVDRFDVPREKFVVSNYLDAGGAIVPSWYSGCGESADLDMGHGILEVDGHNRQVHINIRASVDPITISIRSQFHNRVPPDTDVMAILSRLHEESNSTFEALITDRVRSDVMGGRKDESV